MQDNYKKLGWFKPHDEYYLKAKKEKQIMERSRFRPMLIRFDWTILSYLLRWSFAKILAKFISA
jgi:hypothetical protein